VTEARVALVIGGSGDVGSQISRALARGGDCVVVADADLGGAQATVSGLDGRGHCALRVDVRVEQSVTDLFETVEAELGPVATLVCVAGGAAVELGPRTLISTTTLDMWIEADALNASATFLCVREFLRRRTADGVADGRVVTIVSSAALMPGTVTCPADATSKAGVLAITRIASLEAGPMGITVNAVISGTSGAPAGDVAETVAFLSSVGARHITGSTDCDRDRRRRRNWIGDLPRACR